MTNLGTKNNILDLDKLIYDCEDGHKLKKYILDLQRQLAYSNKSSLILASFMIWLRNYENEYVNDFFVLLRLSEIKDKLEELEKRYKNE